MSKVSNVLSMMGIRKPVQAAKAAKATAATVSKKAPKASAADIMANQGRAMVKKPSAETVKMGNPRDYKATSEWGGAGGDGGYGNGGGGGGWGDSGWDVWE